MPDFVDFSLLTSILIVSTIFLVRLVHESLGLGFPLFATPLFALQTEVLITMLIMLFFTLTVNRVTILFSGGW